MIPSDTHVLNIFYIFLSPIAAKASSPSSPDTSGMISRFRNVSLDQCDSTHQSRLEEISIGSPTNLNFSHITFPCAATADELDSDKTAVEAEDHVFLLAIEAGCSDENEVSHCMMPLSTHTTHTHLLSFSFSLTVWCACLSII